MPAFGAVVALLDACVLVPASLRDTLLTTAELGLYQPRWSREITEELARTLVTRGLATQQQAWHLVREIRAAFPEAVVTGYAHLVPQMTNHEDDRHVLAAAVHGRAHVLVTSNTRHFPAAALAPHWIERQTPDEFLSDLLVTDAARMVEALHEQAAQLHRPPRGVGEILASLERHAPTFACRARSLLLIG